MPVVRANIGGFRIGLGILVRAVGVVAGWFDTLRHPLIYYSFEILLGPWIGLSFEEPNLGRCLFTAFVLSIGACVVLVVVGLAIEHIKLGGWDAGGPVLGEAVIVVLVGLPVMILAMIVAAIAHALADGMTASIPNRLSLDAPAVKKAVEIDAVSRR